MNDTILLLAREDATIAACVNHWRVKNWTWEHCLNAAVGYLNQDCESLVDRILEYPKPQESPKYREIYLDYLLYLSQCRPEEAIPKILKIKRDLQDYLVFLIAHNPPTVIIPKEDWERWNGKQ